MATEKSMAILEEIKALTLKKKQLKKWLLKHTNRKPEQEGFVQFWKNP